MSFFTSSRAALTVLQSSATGGVEDPISMTMDLLIVVIVPNNVSRNFTVSNSAIILFVPSVLLKLWYHHHEFKTVFCCRNRPDGAVHEPKKIVCGKQLQFVRLHGISLVAISD